MKKEIKGMILAIENGYATVLTPDGQFVNYKLIEEGCYIGDEISLQTASNLDFASQSNWLRQALKRPMLRATFSLGVIFVSAISSWAYPIGHVYMDVNPSIGISYNVYHRVIGLESFNEDGETIRKSINLYGKSIEEGVETSLLAMNEKGFVQDESSGLILGFSQDSTSVKASTLDAVSVVVNKVEKVINVASVKVEKNEARQALSVGSSPIKVAIVTAESKKKSDKESDKGSKSTITEAQMKTGVNLLEHQTTSEIIQSNPEILPPVNDSRLEKIKKTLKNKKEQLKKLQNKEQEDAKSALLKKQEQLKLEILKKQEQKKQLNQRRQKNQNQNPNQTEAIPVINENQNEADQIENVSDSDAAEKIKVLIMRKQKLEALKLKLLDAHLKPEEQRLRLEKVEKQLKQIDQLLEGMKDKPNKGNRKK